MKVYKDKKIQLSYFVEFSLKSKGFYTASSFSFRFCCLKSFPFITSFTKEPINST